MKPKDIKEIDDSFKRKAWKTLLYCVLAVIIFIIGAYCFGFFGEKGKQKATTRNSEGKPEPPVHIEQQTKGDGSPAVVTEGDVVESKISIQGGVNVEISPDSKERNEEELAVFPKYIEFYRNRKLSKCDIFLENRTDKTLYSIEFEASIDNLDKRCEEITIHKKGESNKAFELDLQGESINYEVLKFKDVVKEDGSRVFHVRLARLGPKEIVPFVATFESNCPLGTIGEKKLRIPVTILDHSKVAPPTFGRNGNKIYAEIPSGSLSLHPDYETDKSKRIIRLEQEKLLELYKKAIVENRPMVIPLPLKDESSGTYSMIKKIEGARGKYLGTYAFKIQNIGVQTAKEVMWRF